MESETCKKCKNCNEYKPLTEFHANNKALDGLQNYCKDCKRTINRNYTNYKYKTDPIFKMIQLFRNRLTKINKSNLHSKSLYGCSIHFLNAWIEYQYDDKMNNSNHGIYWHYDHVLPISRFDMNDEDELKTIWNWKNLRPLEKIENKIKSDKIDLELYNQQILKAAEFVKLYNSISTVKHHENDDLETEV